MIIHRPRCEQFHALNKERIYIWTAFFFCKVSWMTSWLFWTVIMNRTDAVHSISSPPPPHVVMLNYQAVRLTYSWNMFPFSLQLCKWYGYSLRWCVCSMCVTRKWMQNPSWCVDCQSGALPSSHGDSDGWHHQHTGQHTRLSSSLCLFMPLFIHHE